MQLMANGVMFIEDPYEDMKYQIDTFNKCFSEGNAAPPLSSLLFSFFLHDAHILVATQMYGTRSEAFFSCYGYTGLQHHEIYSHPYILDSIYVFQVINWLRYFPRNQILFVRGEDILSLPSSRYMFSLLPLLAFFFLFFFEDY